MWEVCCKLGSKLKTNLSLWYLLDSVFKHVVAFSMLLKESCTREDVLIKVKIILKLWQCNQC